MEINDEEENHGKICFSINLNPNEKKYYELKAKELGVSISEVIRRIAKEKIKAEGLIELEEFIPCTSKDFEDIDQIFPVINLKLIPVCDDRGFVVRSEWKGDYPIFSDNPQIQKQIIEKIEFCKINHIPFALEDFLKNGK